METKTYKKGTRCPYNGECNQDSVGLNHFCHNAKGPGGNCVLTKTITITIG
jgi:hypothetical protein